MLGNLSRGFSDSAQGARFLAARPRLWGWVAAPAALSILLLIGLALTGAWLLGGVVDWTVGWMPDSIESLAGGILRVVVVLLLLTAGYFVFLSLAVLLAAPFNEMLSEAIEEELTGAAGQPFSVTIFLRDVVVGITHALRRVSKYLATMAVLFLVGALVPAVGPIVYLVGGMLVSARFAAFDAYDAIFARKGWAYRDKLAFLDRHRARTYGLGGAIAVMMLVPALNLLALSIGATAATLCYTEVERPALPRA